MSLLRKLLLPFGLLATGAATWWGLSRPPPPATWCTLEAQAHATIGHTFDMRVRTHALGAAEVFSADLHWTTSRHEPRGFLAPGKIAVPSGRDGVFDLRFDVPAREDLAYVHAVVCVGPNTNWADRTLAAASAPIAVRPAGSARADAMVHPLAAYDEVTRLPTAPPDSWIARGLTAACWLIAGVLCWRRRAHPGAVALVVGCVLAVLWELSPAEKLLGEAARTFAVDRRLYAERGPFQLIITTAIAMATVALGTFTVQRVRSAAWRVAWLGGGLYAGISLASFLSLHDLDTLFATTVAGISVLQLGQLAAAALTLTGCGLVRPAAQA